MKNKLLCCKIVNTHGIRGEVKLIMYTDGPEFFDDIKKLYTKDDDILNIVSLRSKKGTLIADIREIDTIEKAQSMKNTELYANREDLPPLSEGRYYVVDILDLDVVTDEGRRLGRIKDVFNTGSNDVYTVVDQNNKEYFIPIIDEVLLNTDMEKGEVLVHLTKGLIDDENWCANPFPWYVWSSYGR